VHFHLATQARFEKRRGKTASKEKKKSINENHSLLVSPGLFFSPKFKFNYIKEYNYYLPEQYQVNVYFYMP
jgi:hypothetical protein